VEANVRFSVSIAKQTVSFRPMLVGQAVAMKDRFGSNLDLLAAFV
jgi:hypothetical protein